MAELAPVVVIGGPTASGKSALALEIAAHFNGEIVNADSMQVYRELSVLTARPSPADEARAPHHLYGICSAKDPCSAGTWLELAEGAVRDIHRRGRLPVVCGGTGLYLKVLREGLAQIPDIDRDVIAETEALYRKLGGSSFVERLAEIDPTAASRLLPSDRQRLVRAYSVAVATGRCLSDWQEDPHRSLTGVRFFVLHLLPDRAALYGKIEARFEAMVAQGAMAEIKALSELSLDPALPAMKALGVPELLAALAGDRPLDAALEQAKKTTRNLAKRQFTWFRNQGKADLVIHDFGGIAVSQGRAAVAGFLDRNPGRGSLASGP